MKLFDNTTMDEAGLIALAKQTGATEGKASVALPKLALVIAASAAAGKLNAQTADQTIRDVYVGYGEARNKSGTGKTINVKSDAAMKAPLSKLRAFYRLGADKTIVPGTNRTIGEVFIETYANDRDLWQGNHYERLYQAVAHQNRVTDKGEARLVERIEIENLFKISAAMNTTQAEQLGNILSAIDLYVNGKKDKKTNAVDARLPGWGDTPKKDFDTFAKLVSKLKAQVEEAAGKDWDKVEEVYNGSRSDDEIDADAPSFVNPKAGASA